MQSYLWPWGRLLQGAFQLIESRADFVNRGVGLRSRLMSSLRASRFTRINSSSFRCIACVLRRCPC